MPGLTNIWNSKRELFPQLPFYSSRLTTNWRMSGPRTGKSAQPNLNMKNFSLLRGPGKTVDVYDDLCNVFLGKKGAIGITCLPLLDTIFTSLISAMK